jgi:hypothetical protein
MAATAMFSLKYPSLLKFDEDARNEDVRMHNIRSVFALKSVPSDTQMRAIIDPVEPAEIHRGLKDIFAHLQQGKVIDGYKYIDDSVLIAADGTGLFSSSTVRCDSCCAKHPKKGEPLYYHQGFSLILVHPTIKSVLPICLETISKDDGATKNDCELNAARRSLRRLRREHPHLSIRMVMDGLFAKAPIVELARSLNMGFIVVAKQGDHQALFQRLEAAKDIGDVGTHSVTEHLGKKTVRKDFFFCNDVPLNDSNSDTLVNVLEYRETTNGTTNRWVWITDLRLTEVNVNSVMRAGRSRWRIENETYNVLKNHGYEFEHNFGHGYNNLCTNLFYLMMLAFLVDQVQELSCKVLGKLLGLAKRHSYLWEQMRSVFRVLRCTSLTDFYEKVGQSYESTFIIDTA